MQKKNHKPNNPSSFKHPFHLNAICGEHQLTKLKSFYNPARSRLPSVGIPSQICSQVRAGHSCFTERCLAVPTRRCFFGLQGNSGLAWEKERHWVKFMEVRNNTMYKNVTRFFRIWGKYLNLYNSSCGRAIPEILAGTQTISGLSWSEQISWTPLPWIPDY